MLGSELEARRIMKERGDDRLIFERAEGGAWHTSHLSQQFPRLARRSKLPAGLRFHDLRHGFASLGFASGTTMQVVSQSLGHASTAITSRIYVYVYDAARDEQANRLDFLLDPVYRKTAEA